MSTTNHLRTWIDHDGETDGHIFRSHFGDLLVPMTASTGDESFFLDGTRSLIQCISGQKDQIVWNQWETNTTITWRYSVRSLQILIRDRPSNPRVDMTRISFQRHCYQNQQEKHLCGNLFAEIRRYLTDVTDAEQYCQCMRLQSLWVSSFEDTHIVFWNVVTRDIDFKKGRLTTCHTRVRDTTGSAFPSYLNCVCFFMKSVVWFSCSTLWHCEPEGRNCEEICLLQTLVLEEDKRESSRTSGSAIHNTSKQFLHCTLTHSRRRGREGPGSTLLEYSPPIVGVPVTHVKSRSLHVATQFFLLSQIIGSICVSSQKKNLGVSSQSMFIISFAKRKRITWNFASFVRVSMCYRTTSTCNFTFPKWYHVFEDRDESLTEWCQEHGRVVACRLIFSHVVVCRVLSWRSCVGRYRMISCRLFVIRDLSWQTTVRQYTRDRLSTDR